MKKLQLYLETSVWNFYFADDAPEKREITLLFFERVKQGDYEIFISDAVISEISKARREKELLLLSLIKDHRPGRLLISEQFVDLAHKYISEGALPENKLEDAIHAAAATVFEMDALISWNLKHLANLKKMEMINGINLKEGYTKRLQLITPMEVSDEDIR
jgi:predicted nucleic acid-binding protein